jgi:predicted outer membrane repeat protein
MKPSFWARPTGVLSSALLAIGMFYLSHPAQAATFTVPAGNATALVNAIHAANMNGEVDTINLLEGTYTLTNTISIFADSGNLLTLNGQGAVISGGNAVRIFQVNGGGNVAFNRVTLTNGFRNEGGAIYNFGGTVSVTNSTLSNNSANFSGGAIYNENGRLTITSSTLSNNNSSLYEGVGGGGGAIYNEFGQLTITRSTLSNNSTGTGGAIGNSGALTVNNSTFSSNSASYHGGAIESSTYSPDQSEPTRFALLQNCTFSGNTTSGYGGGVFNRSGLMRIESCTLAGNSAPLNGGAGVGSSGDNATLTRVQNSIIADNRIAGDNANSGTDVDFVINDFNPFQSQGHNLIGDGKATGSFNASSDRTGVSATQLALGELADNGGSTSTRALER